MGEWTNKNLAHVHVWVCLVALRELPSTQTFDVSGSVPMEGLAFWSNLDSPEVRASKATALAAQMDNVFRLFQGARYEAGIDRASAVLAMSNMLQKSQQQLHDLADSADECYRYKNEAHA